MSLKNLFFVLTVLCSSVVGAREMSVAHRSVAFPTTSNGVIRRMTLTSPVSDPEKMEGHLLLTAMILINSGEANVVGLDMTLTDGLVSGIILHVVEGRGEGNRIRMFFQTKRYPEGLMDAPLRMAKWMTLSPSDKIASSVIPEEEDATRVLVALIFYQESRATAGRIPPELVATAREALKDP